MSDSENKTYVNTTDSSVVIDDEGHMLDGGGSDQLERTEQVRHLLKAGLLVEAPEEAAKGRTNEQKYNLSVAAGEDPDATKDSGKVSTKSKSSNTKEGK